MVGTILLVLTEGFNDLIFLSCQVILEENGNDVIIVSKMNGACKGEDSSVITVSLDDALKQNEYYSAIVVVGGNNITNWEVLEKTIQNFHQEKRILGFVGETIDLLGTNNTLISEFTNIIHMLENDDAEQFAEKIAMMIK
ncbi:MAG: DJ-1/PfpI family protein [Candidatus Kariarchaeaceae archaeon]|jgi:putative intracellular protease/amidase